MQLESGGGARYLIGTPICWFAAYTLYQPSMFRAGGDPLSYLRFIQPRPLSFLYFIGGGVAFLLLAFVGVFEARSKKITVEWQRQFVAVDETGLLFRKPVRHTFLLSGVESIEKAVERGSGGMNGYMINLSFKNGMRTRLFASESPTLIDQLYDRYSLRFLQSRE